MGEASSVRVTGPLAACAPAFVGYLTELGYADTSAAQHVRRLVRLSAWLEREGVDPTAVDEAVVSRVVDGLRRPTRVRNDTPASFRLVLRFLRERGVVLPAPAPIPSPMDLLLADYRLYLVVERAVAPLTLGGYLTSASRFLAETCGGDPERVRELSAASVASFVLKVAETRSPASVNTVVVGVRSLLRWLYLTDAVDTHLAQATPWLSRGNTSTLPRVAEEGQAAALLATCTPGTLAGARSLAVLTLLVRLGLRAGEVAALLLDDIDWRRGEVDVRGKGGVRDPLPLPVDAGEALVAYLRLRGRHEFRNVFAQVRAPHGPMTMTNVRYVVHQACERAGIADTGTHRLRHGVATDLLRHGAPLHEIGQVLRHRDISTTAHYAKVDFAALATVARPWPGTGR